MNSVRGSIEWYWIAYALALVTIVGWQLVKVGP